MSTLGADRADLVWGATHVPGLIEFWREGDEEDVCFASRGELEAALRAAEQRDVRLGGVNGVWVDWSDVKLLLTELDGHDRARRAS